MAKDGEEQLKLKFRPAPAIIIFLVALLFGMIAGWLLKGLVTGLSHVGMDKPAASQSD